MTQGALKVARISRTSPSKTLRHVLDTSHSLSLRGSGHICSSARPSNPNSPARTPRRPLTGGGFHFWTVLCPRSACSDQYAKLAQGLVAEKLLPGLMMICAYSLAAML
jgi:hypothetical protein